MFLVELFCNYCSGKTDMNGSSYRNDVNHRIFLTIYEGFPSQGPGTARRGKFWFSVKQGVEAAAGAPPRERLRGGGGSYRNGGMGASAPIISPTRFSWENLRRHDRPPCANPAPALGRGRMRCLGITCTENLYKLCTGNPALSQPGNVIICRDIHTTDPIQTQTMKNR